ncbi:MAG: ABC transporter permease [Spirochaetales bacterium]|nr:ABC transporter permease [Spirochaetales bacterium]
MTIVHIAWKYIIQNIKRPIGLGLLILGPIFLIFILGQAFSVIFAPGQVSLEMDIGFYSREKGAFYSGFRTYIRRLEVNKIRGHETASIEDGEAKTSEGIYQAFVILDEKQKNCEVVVNNNSGLKAGIIEGILKGFSDQFHFYELIARYKPEALNSVLTVKESDFVIRTALDASRRPRAIDYFGITILTMAILFGAIFGSSLVEREKTVRTLDRIYVAPVTKMQFLLGTCIGILTLLLFQLGAVFMTLKYILGIYYGENSITVFILLLSESFFALALGIGFATLFKNSKASIGFLNFLIPVMIFLGGGYMKLPDTKLFEILSAFSPLGWINKALFEMIYSTSHIYYVPAVVICIAGGALLLGISGLKFSGRRSL